MLERKKKKTKTHGISRYPCRKRVQREEIDRRALADNLIGGIDRRRKSEEKPKEQPKVRPNVRRHQIDHTESRCRCTRYQDGRICRRTRTAHQTSSGDCPDAQRGDVTADRDAVSRVRRRIVRPRSPAAEREIPTTRTAVHSTANGNTDTASGETDEEKEINRMVIKKHNRIVFRIEDTELKNICIFAVAKVSESPIAR